jgi:hypothetical protein
MRVRLHLRCAIAVAEQDRNRANSIVIGDSIVLLPSKIALVDSIALANSIARNKKQPNNQTPNPTLNWLATVKNIKNTSIFQSRNAG